MPTILTHGIVAASLAAKAQGKTRVILLALLCAILPDLDYVGFKFGVQYNSLFGHRGFTHSFFFAALTALFVSALLSRREKNLKSFLKLFLLFFLATASHPILDALTDGGEGVAFFSPFSNHRYFFPWRPILVSPLGIQAFFSWRGFLVLVNEFLFVVAPLLFVLFFPKLETLKTKWPKTLALLALWITSLILLTSLRPLGNTAVHHSEQPVIDLYTKQYADNWVLSAIPTTGLPNQKLVTKIHELNSRGLFNKRLEAKDLADHWASGFFPNWYGGIAGRWQDSNYKLLLRSFFGYGVPDSATIQNLLKDPSKKDYLFRLSPTEKYDLYVGDYNFSSTRHILSITHNAEGLIPFWYGICNGMAAASKFYKEPFRSVDVINPNGFKLRFHPNDVKALVGHALSDVSQWVWLGRNCTVNGPEAKQCRINPGALLIATLNRLGLAREGFIVNGFSGTRKQYYLFDAAQVDILKGPISTASIKDWIVPTSVKQVMAVRFRMELVSTILGDKAGDTVDPNKGESYYEKVGRVVVPKTLDALIALGQDGEILGGSWLGDQDVTDVILFPNSLPNVGDDGNRLKLFPALKWSVIRQIYEQSINENKSRAVLDFSL